MVVAMMVPVTLPAVRYVGLNSMRRRRQRAMALYTAVYVGIWALFGVTALGIDHLLRAHLGLGDRLLLALALVAAAGWQLTRAKRRALFACGRTVPLPPLGRRADAGCARFALLHALALHPVVLGDHARHGRRRPLEPRVDGRADGARRRRGADGARPRPHPPGGRRARPGRGSGRARRVTAACSATCGAKSRATWMLSS